jgi:hypothetical protein
MEKENNEMNVIQGIHTSNCSRASVDWPDTENCLRLIYYAQGNLNICILLLHVSTKLDREFFISDVECIWQLVLLK